MVAGADVSEFPLRHGDHPVIGPLHRSADLLGLLGQPLRFRFAPLGRRFGRSGQERGPQHRHRLGRAERVVVERDHRAELRPLLQPDRADLLRRDEPAPLGHLRGHLGLDPLVQRPAGRRVVRLPLPPDEDLAVRADVLVVQRPHHVAVDLAGEAERRGAGALPVAGRLPRRAGVVVGALAVAHGVSQVRRVVAGVQAQHGRSLLSREPQAAGFHRDAQRKRP